MRTNKKWVITAALLSALAAGSLYASANSRPPIDSKVYPPSASTHIRVHKPYAEFEKPSVYNKLSTSWNNSVEKISKKYGDQFNPNDWELIAEPDTDIRFTNQLSSEDASAYFKASIEAKSAYRTGDLLNCLLLHKNKQAAKIVWERADGKTHVAHLKSSNRDGKIEWNVVFEEEIE